MKMLFWYGGSDIRIIEKRLPKINSKEVLIKIAYSGVCGSDVHIIDGLISAPPRAIGHEFSGTAEEIGSEVLNCKVGDKVIAHPHVTCGECEFCQSGNQQLCPNGKIDIKYGAFTEYKIVDSNRIFVLPDKISLLNAALTEPLSIAVHTFELSKFIPGDMVVVLGGGPIGLLCAKYAQHLGARLVILSEPSPDRIKVARDMDFGIVTDPENLEEIVKKESKGLGADICVDAVALKPTVKQALRMVRKGGQIIITGISSEDTIIDIKPRELYSMEMGIIGVFWSNNSSMIIAAKLLSAWGNELKPMITVFKGLDSFSKIINSLREKKIQKGIIEV